MRKKLNLPSILYILGVMAFVPMLVWSLPASAGNTCFNGCPDNSKDNSVNNSTTQGQQQGQQQGIANSGNSNQGQGQSQQTRNANNSKLKTSVNVGGDVYEAERIPVATARGGDVGAAGGGQYACLVGISVGGQAVGFGASFGTAVRDVDCVIMQLANMPAMHPEVRTALLCQIPEYAVADLTCKSNEVATAKPAKQVTYRTNAKDRHFNGVAYVDNN